MERYKVHGNNHKEITLKHGSVHIFANEEIFSHLEPEVYTMADNNLAIPRNQFFSYTPDVHVGVGTCIGTTAVWNMKDGFVSPSIVGVDIGCGMRVHLTNLHKDDLKNKNLRKHLIETIEKYLPTNERTNSHYEDIDVESIVKQGLHGLPSQYKESFGDTSLTHVEHSHFQFKTDYLDMLPQKIWKVSHGQIGTLGGGNHFVEIQYVKIEENNRELAQKWGLFDGQVVIMIHSGSRSWGAMLGREYTKMIKAEMEKWGITNPDPNLIYAPIHTEVGQIYLNLMYSALNFAVTNRHMIAHAVQEGFKEVVGQHFKMPVLYDLMHNYALKEYHDELQLVHRKGATRALPAGHFLNVKAYKETGHPALIPGSMGTSSYIMVGQPEGKKNYYSICHGAGRVYSRKAARENVTVDEFAHALRVGTDEEIIVNHRTLETILDECPQAYKDIDQIIDSVVGAGLAKVVAQCKPMAVIKGI